MPKRGIKYKNVRMFMLSKRIFALGIFIMGVKSCWFEVIWSVLRKEKN